MPDLADEFALSGAQTGLVLAAGSLSTALVPAGSLVDRVGPRRPLLVSAALAAAFLTSAAGADSVFTLVTAFFGFGVCQAVITLAGAVSIFQTFEQSRRGMAMGVRQMAVSLGGLVAAGLLPGLAAVGGVRLALLAGAVLAGFCSLAFGLVSPRNGAPGRRGALRPDLPDLLRRPGMVRILVLSACYVVSLSAVLGFAVAALRSEGASVSLGSALFVVISLAAMAARLV